MMTRKEFCIQLVPEVLELQKECQKMTEEEFETYRKEVLQTIHQTMPDISERFMVEIFHLTHQRIFAVGGWNVA